MCGRCAGEEDAAPARDPRPRGLPQPLAQPVPLRLQRHGGLRRSQGPPCSCSCCVRCAGAKARPLSRAHLAGYPRGSGNRVGDRTGAAPGEWRGGGQRPLSATCPGTISPRVRLWEKGEGLRGPSAELSPLTLPRLHVPVEEDSPIFLFREAASTCAPVPPRSVPQPSTAGGESLISESGAPPSPGRGVRLPHVLCFQDSCVPTATPTPTTA